VCGVLASVCLLFDNFRSGCDTFKDLWTGHPLLLAVWVPLHLTLTGGVSLGFGSLKGASHHT
jgi:hypothetical protein